MQDFFWGVYNINVLIIQYNYTNYCRSSYLLYWLFLDCSHIVSSMAKASDNMGLQRALGSSYFTMCSFEPEVFQWFIELEGSVLAYRIICFQYIPGDKKIWRDRFVGTYLVRSSIVIQTAVSINVRLNQLIGQFMFKNILYLFNKCMLYVNRMHSFKKIDPQKWHT